MVKFQRVLQKMVRVTVAQKQLGGKVRRENEVCKLPVLGFPSTKGGLQNWSWKSRHNSSLLRKESPALDLGPSKYRIKTDLVPLISQNAWHPRAAVARPTHGLRWPRSRAWAATFEGFEASDEYRLMGMG